MEEHLFRREADWNGIVVLYETFMTMRSSPVVALNRAIAIAQRDGPARGVEEIGRIADRGRLIKYPFYFTALGEFERRLGHAQAARTHYEAALKVARNAPERRFLQTRLETLA